MKKNKIISLRLTEEDELKLEKVARFFNRSIGEVARLSMMEKIDNLFEQVLIQESKGIVKKAIFKTE